MYLLIRTAAARDDTRGGARPQNGVRVAGDVYAFQPDDWLDAPHTDGSQRNFGREEEKRCLVIRCRDIPMAALEALMDSEYHETEPDPEGKPGVNLRTDFRALRFDRAALEQINLGSLFSIVATAFTPGEALPRDGTGKPIVPEVQWVELKKALRHKRRARRAVDPDDLVPERVRIAARRQALSVADGGR